MHKLEAIQKSYFQKKVYSYWIGLKADFLEITPTIIGEKIRLLRKSKGLTQTELAELVLKDRQYLYKIEKGLVTPNISTITILAKATGIFVITLRQVGE